MIFLAFGDFWLLSGSECGLLSISISLSPPLQPVLTFPHYTIILTYYLLSTLCLFKDANKKAKSKDKKDYTIRQNVDLCIPIQVSSGSC